MSVGYRRQWHYTTNQQWRTSVIRSCNEKGGFGWTYEHFWLDTMPQVKRMHMSLKMDEHSDGRFGKNGTMGVNSGNWQNAEEKRIVKAAHHSRLSKPEQKKEWWTLINRVWEKSGSNLHRYVPPLCWLVVVPMFTKNIKKSIQLTLARTEPQLHSSLTHLHEYDCLIQNFKAILYYQEMDEPIYTTLN